MIENETPDLPPTDRLCLTVAEAADALRVSPRQVYNLAHKAGLPTLKLGGRRLVRVADLTAWIEKQPVAMFEVKKGEPPGPDRPDGPTATEAGL